MPDEPIYILTEDAFLFSNTIIKESHFPYKELSLNTAFTDMNKVNSNDPKNKPGTGFFSNEITDYLDSDHESESSERRWGFDGYLNSKLWFDNDRDDFFNKVLLGIGFENSFITCYTSYFTDQELANDSDYQGKKWGEFAGGPEQVFITFQPLGNPYFTFKVGKDYLGWGEGLLLSPYHPPFDHFIVEAGNSTIKFIGFTAFLDKIELSDSLSEVYHVDQVPRFLSGHRLIFGYKNLFSFGLSELILYGGPNRNIEPRYLIPLYWFHAEQLNSKIDDNTFLSMDFQLKINSFLFSGEILMDDIQIENEKQSDQEPAEYGFSIGLAKGLNIYEHPVTVGLDYTRVTNRTYNQLLEWNKFVYDNKLLGSQQGNDFDELSVWCRYWLTSSLPLKLELSYSRDGEGDVFDDWSEPWLENEGDYSEEFPTGIVEKKTMVGIEAKKWFNRFANATVNFDWISIKNYQHENDKNKNIWRLNFAVTFRYSQFQWH